ncbi:uncharacterized protein JCM6883_005965 [Sporobolomyces salmoneus]|uniref:uncharacterized protein n=1 Tax=Sporobolomyces salmoneus TaxID=183962 RepID=UPI00317ECCD4
MTPEPPRVDEHAVTPEPPKEPSPRDPEGDAEDDSSLTSLSDLDAGGEDEEQGDAEREGDERETPQPLRAEAGKRAEIEDGSNRAQDKGGVEARRDVRDGNPGESPSIYCQARHPLGKPILTPILDGLLSQRYQHLEHTVREATNIYALQESSYTVVQAAIEGLPSGEQQTMISLMLNRYACFCTSVDIPLFPLSPIKVSFFLSQALGVDYRDVSHRSNKLPLPTIDPSSVTLSRDEGTRLTQELAESWVQSLNFAQLSAVNIWQKVIPSSPSLEPLGSDPIVREIVSAMPTILDWQEWENRPENSTVPVSTDVRPQPVTTTTNSTRWTKQGRPVAGPSRAPASSSSAPSSSIRNGAYAFEMPLP